MQLLVCAVVVLQCVAAQQESVVRYDGHKVYRVSPGSIKHISDILVDIGLDVWNHATDDDDVIVMVTPEQEVTFSQYIKQNGLTADLLIEDLQQHIESEQRELNYRTKRRAPSLLEDISVRYLSFNEMLNFMSSVKNHGSKNGDVQIINYGTSSEGRVLQAMKITRGNTCKPGILLDGGFHAREWISPATVLRFIYELVLNPANVDLLDKFDWYIIPMVNPDGYEYSRSTDRMWRKTRNVNAGSTCRGTDPNRNFAYKWNPYAGASTNPCSEVYAGPNALSVPETASLANFMNNYKDKLKLYLTVHNFGTTFLYPYGYSNRARAPDHAQLTSLANVARAAMTAYPYGVASSGSDFGVAAGGSDDYAKGAMKIKYSYTLELPENSFILSPTKISRVASDAWNGIRVMVLRLSTLEYTRTLPCSPNTTTPTTPRPTTPRPTTPRPTTPKPTTPKRTGKPSTHPCCVYMKLYTGYAGYYDLLRRCCELYG